MSFDTRFANDINVTREGDSVCLLIERGDQVTAGPRCFTASDTVEIWISLSAALQAGCKLLELGLGHERMHRVRRRFEHEENKRFAAGMGWPAEAEDLGPLGDAENG